MANLGIVIDIETGGLDHKQFSILELSGLIYNKDTFEVVSTFSRLIVDNYSVAMLRWLEAAANSTGFKPTDEPHHSAKIVYDMHKKSGLFNEVISYFEQDNLFTMEQCEEEFIDWMNSFGLGKGHIMASATGSSVHFDIKFLEVYMPKIVENLHYRQLNISAIKVVVDYYMPKMKQKRYDSLDPKMKHRGLSDCYDSLEELKFYLENVFLPVEKLVSDVSSMG